MTSSDPATAAPGWPPPRPGHTRLFVYGTLKSGCRNHHELAGQTHLGAARTAAGHRLYSLGEYPGLVVAPGHPDGVQGEVWDVTPAALARLDVFEGVPEGLYRRDRVALAPPHDHVAAETYFYLRSLNGRPALGDRWLE